MRCQNCGKAHSQGDQFCGNCGAVLGAAQAATIVVAQGDQPDYDAATIVDQDVETAIIALENPYNSHLGHHKMPKLILNDDMKRVWREIHQQGTAKVRRWAQYTTEGLHIVGDYDDDKGYQDMNIVQNSPVIFGETFTLQTLIRFYPTELRNDVYIEFGTSPNESIVWHLTANKGELWGRGYATFPDEADGSMTSWKLRYPAYHPFLLGLVCQDRTWLVFLNLEHIGYQQFKNAVTTERIQVSIGWSANLSISHTKVWVPE